MLDSMKIKLYVLTCVFDVYGLQLKAMGCSSYSISYVLFERLIDIRLLYEVLLCIIICIISIGLLVGIKIYIIRQIVGTSQEPTIRRCF
jgi:hypothetical protein